MKKFSVLLLQLFIAFFATAQLPQLNLVQLATGYASPVDIKSCGDQRIFVVEQKGIIRILYKDGSKQTNPFLDIDARVNNAQDEQGLLGLAFSPNFKQDGNFYVQYTTGPGVDSIRISRFHVMAGDSTQADPASEQVLISYKDVYWNHNGGNLMFGPDGYLYASEGDGGSGDDPNGNGQNKNTWFAKVLRIDVSNQAGYSIPASNPFVGVANTKPEIWAYGLRNPWRCSFDKITGDMWIGDVGQNTYEEIDFQAAGSAGGQNYGWRCREGLHVCPTSNTSGCPSSGFVDPVAEISHGSGSCSVTGGYVYRGTQYGKLFGLYLFTDYCDGSFWTIKKTGNTFDVDTLQNFSNYQYTTFGQDDLGELYVGYRGSATGTTGRIYKITETTNCNPVAFITYKDTLEGCRPLIISALQGDTLAYQWYNSSGIIGGATSYQLNVPQSGWYKVKVSKTLHAGCEAMSDSVYVNLFDTTALTVNVITSTHCVNEATFDLANFVSPVGGVFSGNGVAGTSFTPSIAGLGTTNVLYEYTNNLTCRSTTNFSIPVVDTVALVATSPLNFCVDAITVSLTGAVQPIGGIYVSNFTSNDSLFSPNAIGVGTSQVDYTFTSVTIPVCVSHKTINVNVGGQTALTKTIIDSIYCNNATAVSMTSFVSPSGGVFSGTGVSGNNFDPATAFVGYNKIWYQYTNSFGCTSVDSFELRVDNCVGIKEVGNEISFRVFPNPSKGNFNLDVKVNSAQLAEIIITDAVGKIIYRKNQLLEPAKPIITLQLSLASGVYAIQLKGTKESVIKTLVVE